MCSVIGFDPYNLVLMGEVERVGEIRLHGEMERRIAGLEYLVVECSPVGAWGRRLSDEVRAPETELRRRTSGDED